MNAKYRLGIYVQKKDSYKLVRWLADHVVGFDAADAACAKKNDELGCGNDPHRVLKPGDRFCMFEDID